MNKFTTSLISLTLLALTSITQHPASALPTSKGNSAYETPTTLSASKILPAHLLKGPYHRVQEKVTSDGYFNNYHIISNFGPIEVEGQQLLEIRIAELNALAELDKLSSSSVFADAAYKAGKGIVLAPVKVVEKTAKIVSDPQKIVDTAAKIPEGAEKLFNWAYRQGKSAASAVSDTFSSSTTTDTTKKENDKASKSTSETVSDTLDQGTKLGLQFIGYTKRQREWFRKLQVNPYTSNDLLRDEIMRVAGIETAVGTAFRFVPGLGLLGQLSTVNRWYERAEKLSLYEDPDTIGRKNQKELRELGVPEETITAFANNKSYTPWTRRFISASLRAIGPNVAGHAEFIRVAAQAQNEPSTLYFVSVAEAFEKRHEQTPLTRIVASNHLPAALLKDGNLYLPLSVDYLFWTEEVAAIFSDFQSRVVAPTNATKTLITVRGSLTPTARARLSNGSTSVTEGAL